MGLPWAEGCRAGGAGAIIPVGVGVPKVTTQLDEIPVARRLTPSVSQQQQRNLWTLLILLLPASVALGAAVVFLRPFLPPTQDTTMPQLVDPSTEPMPQPEADGRLLGHFPYPVAQGADLVEVAPGRRLHGDAAAAFLDMRRDAAADGVQLRLLSAFRDQETQHDLFFPVMVERSQRPEERAQVSAPPGYSEHHTGYALDLGDARRPELDLDSAFEQSAAFAWLQENAARYHFRLSFPADNRQGVAYEPWHWRWEGSSHALELFQQARRFNAATLGTQPFND